MRFYTDVLGMRVSDRLGDERRVVPHRHRPPRDGVDRQGHSHFHHLAFDVVDIGQMRDLLDRLAPPRPLARLGAGAHGVGGNIASYVRIVEEECFVELYCDMEQLAGRPRAARLARRPLLVEHVGAAAAALVLPLRPGRDRVRAREPGDSAARCRRTDDAGLHDPAHAARAAPRSSRRRRGTTSATSSCRVLGRPGRGARRCCPPGSSRTPTPGRCAAVFADWQSCSEGGDELIDPSRSQYKEFFLVVNALLDGEEVTTCPYIWVDRDFALARGWLQGFPKKLGSVWMTRTFGLDCAGRPRPHGRARAYGGDLRRPRPRGRRGDVTLERVSEDGPTHNAPPIVNVRHFAAPRRRAATTSRPCTSSCARAAATGPSREIWEGRPR